jgi:hypothetical protein
MTHNKNFQPMKKYVGPHKNNFRPMKNQYGQILTNHDYKPTQKCCKSATKHYKPIKNHAWHNTVPDYTVAHRGQPRKNVANTRSQTSHAQRGQRSKKCNNDRNERADTDDRYLSQLKALTHQQDTQKNIEMKTPSILKTLRNPVSKTSHSVPHKLSSTIKNVKYLTPDLLEQDNIKQLIGEQRLRHQAKMHKRDAIIAVQSQFFAALRNLYTWPLDSLILANIIEVRDFWELQLQTARQCSYRAETIDPNHYGELRYDIMAEIVKLESCRIADFLAAFQHHHNFMHDGDVTDALRCDNQMLSFFDPIQTNVILAIPPQWVEEARRPPLTWYAFLSRQEPAPVTTDRILAAEYYDSSGSNSS